MSAMIYLLAHQDVLAHTGATYCVLPYVWQTDVMTETVSLT